MEGKKTTAGAGSAAGTVVMYGRARGGGGGQPGRRFKDSGGARAGMARLAGRGPGMRAGQVGTSGWTNKQHVRKSKPHPLPLSRPSPAATLPIGNLLALRPNARPPLHCPAAVARPLVRLRAPSQRLRGVEHFSVQPCTSPSLIHESPARVEPVSGSSLTIHGGEGLALPLQRDDVTRMVGASDPCRRTHQAPAASPSQPIAANRSQSPAPFSGGHPAAQHRVVGREAEALASKTPVIVCYMTIPRCPYQMYSPPRGWFRAKRTAYQQSQTQASGSSGGGKPSSQRADQPRKHRVASPRFPTPKLSTPTRGAL